MSLTVKNMLGRISEIPEKVINVCLMHLSPVYVFVQSLNNILTDIKSCTDK